MSKPKLTWANFKKDKWLHIQILVVIIVAAITIASA